MLIILKNAYLISQPGPGCSCSGGISNNSEVEIPHITCNDCLRRHEKDAEKWKQK